MRAIVVVEKLQSLVGQCRWATEDGEVDQARLTVSQSSIPRKVQIISLKLRFAKREFPSKPFLNYFFLFLGLTDWLDGIEEVDSRRRCGRENRFEESRGRERESRFE